MDAWMGTRRCTEVCAEAHRDLQKGADGCTGECRGTCRCAEEC